LVCAWAYLRVEDPFLDATIGLVCGVLGLGPVDLDLLSEALGVLLSALLRLLALESEVVLQRLGVPAVVGSDDLVVPVVLYRVLQIFAVGGRRVRDAVV
jgi:hypothetical protein